MTHLVARMTFLFIVWNSHA